MRWPPVPPPARRTLTALSRARRPPPAPNADQPPRRHQCDEQARAAVRDERQRDARRGEQRQADTNVQRGGGADQGGEPHGEQPPERIARGPCDPEPEPDERAEQEEDDDHADESPLLADGRENEIRVRVREVAELLLSLPQPYAEQPARPDPH